MTQGQLEWRLVTDQYAYSILSILYYGYLAFAILFGLGTLLKFFRVMGVTSRQTKHLLRETAELIRVGKHENSMHLLTRLPRNSPEEGLRQATERAAEGSHAGLASILPDAEVSFSATFGAVQIGVKRLEMLGGIVILASLVVLLADPFHIYGALVALRSPSLADFMPGMRGSVLQLYAGSWTLLVIYVIRCYVSLRLASRRLVWDTFCASLKNR